MIEAPPHPREKIRLNVLRDTGLFNNLQEAEYERFVTVASGIADTPIALLSLIGENSQWFKAKIGLGVNETPRNVSFCGHAILSERDPLVVEDATFDMRFCDNPLVAGDPGIRFYAGIPIRLSADRLPIGTICVIDKKPRKLTEDKIAALAALGEILEHFITSKMRIAKLEAAMIPPASVMRRP